MKPQSERRRFPATVIRASAGTGKTFQLSNRFIALLAAGEKPERILATTFTRKAAGEIQQRVFERLASAASSAAACTALASQIGMEGFCPQAALKCLKELVHGQHRLRICTFDSFFVALAKSFANQLGLTGSPLNIDIEQNSQNRSTALCALVEGMPAAELHKIMLALGHERVRRSLHKTLTDKLSELSFCAENSSVDAWNWDAPESPLGPDQFTELVARLAELKAPLTKKGAPDRRWEKSFADAEVHLRAADWQAFLGTGIAAKVVDGSWKIFGASVPEEMREIFTPLVAHARALYMRRIAEETSAAHAICTLYLAKLRTLEQISGRYSLNTIKRLLAEAAIMTELEDLYFRLDSSISHILLDEFQDTSAYEWRVLEPLVAEVLSWSDGSRSFLCVGDAKQAIYGWRGGVAEIFDNLESRWTHLEVTPNDISRRCAQPVIDAVNAVFTALPAIPALGNNQEAAREWSLRFRRHEATDENSMGYVCLKEAGADGADAANQKQFLQELAGDIQSIRASAPWASIGVLVRRNKTVAEIIFELGQEPYNIRASEEGGNFLSDSPAVCAVLALLKMTDHPTATVSRFHVASSALGKAVNFTDFHNDSAAIRLVREVREKLANAGYGALISSLTRDLLPFCSARDKQRLHQLCEFAYEVGNLPRIRTREFVEMVETTRIDSPSPAPVRVMTVHQAKGLEFDIVVLPELDFKLADLSFSTFSSCSETPLDPPSRVCARQTNSLMRAIDPQFARMHQQGTAARLKEELSVLYVALTRAKYALYMLVRKAANSSAPSFTYAAILRCALNTQAAAQSTLLYENGSASWYSTIESKISESDDSMPPPTPAATTPSKPTSAGSRILRGFTREAPSGLEGSGTVDIAQIFSRSGERAAELGRFWHRLFESIDWIDGGLPDKDSLLKCAHGISLENESIASVVEKFLALLRGGGEIAALLCRQSYNCAWKGDITVLREYPFAYRSGDAIVMGVFDRVVTHVVNDSVASAEVIDFKTDRVSPDGLQEKIEFYRPQLDAYRKAAARFFKLPESAVNSKLAFVTLDQVISV